MTRKFTKIVASLAAGLTTALALAVATGTFAVSSTPAVAGVPLVARCVTTNLVADPCGSSFYRAILVSNYNFYGDAYAEVTQRGVYSDRTACAQTTLTTTSSVDCRVTAWRWTSSGWAQTSRRVGARVWVQPFATDWSWTWTSGAGWLAMRDTKLVVKWEPMMVAT
jgi:hypothetical protein